MFPVILRIQHISIRPPDVLSYLKKHLCTHEGNWGRKLQLGEISPGQRLDLRGPCSSVFSHGAQVYLQNIISLRGSYLK